MRGLLLQAPRRCSRCTRARHTSLGGAPTPSSLLQVMTPKVIGSIVTKAARLHGGLGLSWELPLASYMLSGHIMGIADGPSEVHKITIAKKVSTRHASQR